MARFARFGSHVVVIVASWLLWPADVAAQATLNVTPTSLNLQATAGTNVPSATVQISRTGNGALRWTVVAPTAAWLTVSPTRGVNNQVLTLTFRTSGLAAGSYSTTFRVQTETGSAVTVNVSVNIVASQVAPVRLTVSCPSNKTVASSNGSPVAVTYSATTSGGVAPVTVSGNPASGSLFSVGTTPVTVTARSSDGQTATCSFSVIVTYVAPTPLAVSCPANSTVASPDGSSIAVTFTPTTSGGVAPVVVSSNPASGSLFPVGATSVAVTARSADGQTANCGFTVTVTYTAPVPPSSTYGPTSAITCGTNAVDIWPGTSIMSVVNLKPAGTTYCLRAGVHSITGAITPKSGDTFVGEYGAVLDGTGWSSSDTTQGAIRAHNQDIDNVTIRNLVIRNMPQKGIHAFRDHSSHWTVEQNEIYNTKTGLQVPSHSVVRGNKLHHNVGNPSDANPGLRGGGYHVSVSTNVLFERNEIAYNGPEQKAIESTLVHFRNNWVHHNLFDGIWHDGNATGSIVEDNLVEDNARNGIVFEVGQQGSIRNNTIRRNGTNGIYLSTSKQTEVTGNRLEENFRGITLFVSCGVVGRWNYTGQMTFDLADNSIHHNTIQLSKSGAYAALFDYSNCTSEQAAPYMTNSKNNKYDWNNYDTPDAGWWWVWAGSKDWSRWKSLPQDVNGTVQ